MSKFIKGMILRQRDLTVRFVVQYLRNRHETDLIYYFSNVCVQDRLGLMDFFYWKF